MVVPAGQPQPAVGTSAVQPDTLGQAVGTEDMTTSSGHEVVAWVGRIVTSKTLVRDSPTFTHDSCVGLHADWALNAREGGAGGAGRDSGAGGTGTVLDSDRCRGIGRRSSQVYGGVQRGPGLWG